METIHREAIEAGLRATEAFESASAQRKNAEDALRQKAVDAVEAKKAASTAELAAVRSALATVIHVSVFSIGDDPDKKHPPWTTATEDVAPTPIRVGTMPKEVIRKLNINGDPMSSGSVTNPVITIRDGGLQSTVPVPVPPFMILVAQPDTLWRITANAATWELEKVIGSSASGQVIVASLFELQDEKSLTVHDEGIPAEFGDDTTVRIKCTTITRSGGAMTMSPVVWSITNPTMFETNTKTGTITTHHAQTHVIDGPGTYIVRLIKPELYSVSCDDNTQTPQRWAVTRHIDRDTSRVKYPILKTALAGAAAAAASG
jgi:hypothetical protein